MRAMALHPGGRFVASSAAADPPSGISVGGGGAGGSSVKGGGAGVNAGGSGVNVGGSGVNAGGSGLNAGGSGVNAGVNVGGIGSSDEVCVWDAWTCELLCRFRYAIHKYTGSEDSRKEKPPNEQTWSK